MTLVSQSCGNRLVFSVSIVEVCPSKSLGNRPFSALISILKHRRIFDRKSFGTLLIKQASKQTPERSKPVSRHDQPVSPIIRTGQEIFRKNGGVCVNHLATRERSPRTLV